MRLMAMTSAMPTTTALMIIIQDRIIKFFEVELSTRKIAQQVGLSYSTVLKATTILRLAILAVAQDAEAFLTGQVEVDETYFGGRRKGKRGRGAFNKTPVFGILERDGIVKVNVVRDVSAESLLNMTIKTVRRGSIVYTDKFRSYEQTPESLSFIGSKIL